MKIEKEIYYWERKKMVCKYTRVVQFVSYNSEAGLMSDQVLSILSAKDSVNWFGTNEGLSLFKNGSLVKNYTKEQGVSKSVRFIKEDKSGGVWIGNVWRWSKMQLNSRKDQFEMNSRINLNMRQLIIYCIRG